MEALQIIIKEQIQLGHREASSSAWNSPVFVIKKKPGKWKMLTDLRRINEIIEPMGPLQPGIPNPALIPKNWHLIIINLKDCFYTIPLQSQDCDKFAFTVPSLNNSQPNQRYQWRVLPQGMLNSPTTCQAYVHQPLQVLREMFATGICYHYMDDILLAHKEKPKVDSVLQEARKLFKEYGLQISEEKIQQVEPWLYLGQKISASIIQPQKVQIRRDSLNTLNDFQKLLGDINWLRPSIGIPTYQLTNLFQTLEGPSDLNSPRQLTPEAEAKLQLIEQQIQAGQLDRIQSLQNLLKYF